MLQPDCLYACECNATISTGCLAQAEASTHLPIMPIVRNDLQWYRLQETTGLLPEVPEEDLPPCYLKAIHAVRESGQQGDWPGNLLNLLEASAELEAPGRRHRFCPRRPSYAPRRLDLLATLALHPSLPQSQ